MPDGPAAVTSSQLSALAAVLSAADAALAAHLRACGAGECFFAYRMLVRHVLHITPPSPLCKLGSACTCQKHTRS